MGIRQEKKLGDMNQQIVKKEAYFKAIFHACKYPLRAVNGILVGTFSSDKTGSKKNAHITDCFPLFHTNIQLSPMLETAILLIEQLLLNRGNNEKILGYYFANQNFDDQELEPIHKIICSKIQSNLSKDEVVCVWNIDNTQIQMASPNFAINLFYQSTKDSQWSVQSGSEALKKSTFAFEDGAAPEEVLLELGKLFRKGMLHNVVDFDLHLDLVSKDFSNASLFQ